MGGAGTADLLLLGGVVHTLDPPRPRAEAVAVRGDRIAAVGGSAEVETLAGPGTRVLALRGRAVVPGFEDAHAHLLAIGLAGLDLDLSAARSFEEVVARVAEAARGRAPGEWVRGRGWHEARWTAPPPGAVRGFPVHQALSAAVPRVPVVLERADAHAVLVNGAAMAARGLTRDAAAPPGGEILRDGRGEPTGLLVDAAQALVAPPPRTPAERRRALSLAQEACLAAGVTSLHDAGSPAEALALFREAAAAGALTVRLHAMVEGLSGMRAQGRSEPAADGGFLAVRAAKLFADGALGSRGAALLEPYADDPATAGLLLASPEEVLEAARHALAHGFQLCTHAIGDRANRLVLDAWERARSERPGARDPRPRLEHAQVLHPDDLPRLARLGVIASVQPCHAPSDRPWAGARLGPARLRGAYAWRSLLAAGARLAAGTDAPIEPLSPVANLHAAVTRQDAAGQPPGGFDPGERLTREEALRAMTLDAAFAAFAEGWRGSVTPGKVADLVVLSRDPMAVTDDELRRLRVDATVVGGRILFERPGA